MNNITSTMLVSMIVNTFLSAIKIITGLIGKSGALIADGVHSFSDLITDIVAIIGGKLSKKPADENHPYGHGKVEYITSMLISTIIIVLGCMIVSKTFIEKLTIPSNIIIIVTIFTIVSKLILANYIIKQGKKYNSNILISSGTESKTDVLSSLVVLLSAFLSSISNEINLFKYADKVAMLIVGILIIKTGVLLLKENVSNILGENEINLELTNSIKDKILKFKKVDKIDNFVLIKYGSYYKLIMELSMNENMTLKEVHNILEKIESKLKKESNIEFITIHVNPTKGLNE